MKTKLDPERLQTFLDAHWSGSNTALAADLGVSRDTVARWLIGGAPHSAALAMAALLHKIPPLC